MCKNQTNEVKLPDEIQISDTPQEIDLIGIEVLQGHCFVNSHHVAERHPAVRIVGGVILAIDVNNHAVAQAHVWNVLNGVHFDVTKDIIWEGRPELDDNAEIRYFVVQYHDQNSFKEGDVFEFSIDTNANVDAIRTILSNNKRGKQ